MDGSPAVTKLLTQLAISSFVCLGINPQDIKALTPIWSQDGQFLLELQTSNDVLIFFYHEGEVFLAKGEQKKPFEKPIEIAVRT